MKHNLETFIPLMLPAVFIVLGGLVISDVPAFIVYTLAILIVVGAVQSVK